MNKRKVIIAVGSIFAFATAIITATAIHLYDKTFGVRVDTDNDFYQFISHEKPSFQREKVVFKSQSGINLTGYFYEYADKNKKGIIVVAHGMGDGHNNYIAEIERFAAEGYLVFAYDSTGSNESEGEKIIGLSQSPIDLKAALDYIYTEEKVKDLPLMLFGHSWGGFAVAAVNNYDVKNDIKAIVAVAGFQKNSNVIKDEGRKIVGNAIGLLMPVINLYEKFLFGENAKYTGIDGLKKTSAKVMIIHSEDDEVVNYKDNFLKYKNEFEDNKNFKFISLKNSGHNILLAQKAKEEIGDIQIKKGNFAKGSEEYKALTYKEYKLTLELDEKVMSEIIEFYDDCNK